MTKPKLGVYRVRVTAKDIREGKRRESMSCPLALAISRSLHCEASVGICMAYPGNGCEGWTLPPAARKFRGLFDEHKPVKPFSFTLRIERDK